MERDYRACSSPSPFSCLLKTPSFITKKMGKGMGQGEEASRAGDALKGGLLWIEGQMFRQVFLWLVC